MMRIPYQEIQMQIQTSTQSVELARIDGQTTALAQRMPALLEASNDFICLTRADFNVGAAALRAVKDYQKQFEVQRLKAVTPLHDVLRTINGWFKSTTAVLEDTEKTYKRKLARFEQDESDRLRREQAAADAKAREQREELERRAKAQADKGNTERAAEMHTRAQAIAAEPVDIAPVKAAGMSFGEHWEFEILDGKQIPLEYLQPDLVKIGQYVRAMKADAKIAGVRVFSRPKVAARGSR
jgi:hypothetical protein